MPENSTWALGGWVIAALGVFGLIIRSIGPWRKQINDVEERLRNELHAEIKDLRQRAKEERDTHALEMRAFNLERDEMGDRLAAMEKKLIRQQLRHNAERALARHQLSNITQCFDAVILLIETNPEKSPEIIAKVKDMRAVQIVAEAEEKAAIRAAEIAYDDGETDHDGN